MLITLDNLSKSAILYINKQNHLTTKYYKMEKIENQKKLKSFFERKNLDGEFILPYFIDTGEGYGPGYLLIRNEKYSTTSSGINYSILIEELKLEEDKVKELLKSQDYRLSQYEKDIYAFLSLDEKGNGIERDIELTIMTKCGPFHSGLRQSQPGLLMNLHHKLEPNLYEVQSWTTGSMISASGFSKQQADEMLDKIWKSYNYGIKEAEQKFSYYFVAW